MSFTVEEALKVATANLASRAQNRSRSNVYTLYYGNDAKRYEGKCDGFTIKQLITEFRSNGGAWRYAFITRKGDDKLLRFFDRTISKKFFSMTRKGRAK